jgi:hypothetical protein
MHNDSSTNLLVLDKPDHNSSNFASTLLENCFTHDFKNASFIQPFPELQGYLNKTVYGDGNLKAVWNNERKTLTVFWRRIQLGLYQRFVSKPIRDVETKIEKMCAVVAELHWKEKHIYIYIKDKACSVQPGYVIFNRPEK